MNVLKSLAVSAVLILGLAGAAMAQPGGEGNNTGCNGQGNPNSPCQGNGGQGGAGGAGIGIGVGVGHVEQKVGVKQDVDVTNVNANTNVNHNVAKQGQAQGQGQKQGQGQGQGQQQATSVNIEGDKVEVPASAPSVFTGSLVASPETCLGSFQAGGSGSNGLISLGLTFGKTYVDPDCTRRMYARSLMLLGGQYNVAAIALLAQDENVAAALKAAGVAIPGQTAKVDTTVPDLKLNTPLGEPKSEAPTSEPSNFGKRTSLEIPAAMAATMAARVAAVQGQ